MAIEGLGRLLIYVGVIIVLLGGFLMLVSKIPWVGKLPGDLVLQRGSFTIWIPITTMVLASIILTVIFNLIGRK